MGDYIFNENALVVGISGWSDIINLLFFLISDHSEHKSNRLASSLSDPAATEAAQCFALSDIEDATKRFERKVGSGGFGVVYYGKLKDGKEIAVKVLTSNSYQGKREFSNEVTDRISCVECVQLVHFPP